MLTSNKNDLMYLLNILESLEKILLYSKECNSAEEFYEFNEQLNFNASLNLLVNIGENVAKISEELKKNYSNLEWSQIKALRNRVVHDYVNIDALMVFDIIKNNLISSRNGLMDLIASELKNGNFDLEEFDLARVSTYYRHIDFKSFVK